MSVIVAEELRYRYPNQTELALDHLSFQIEKGEFIGILGASGAGKSTLCQAMVGLIPHFHKGAYGGKMIVDGKLVRETEIWQLASHVGMVFQNPETQLSGAKLTVYEEVAFGLENLGIPRAEMRRRVDQSLNIMGIETIKDRNPYDLSGGQKQRVAIAGVLAMYPKIIIFDEPTSQLDPQGTNEVYQAIKTLSLEGMTVIVVEHNMEMLARYSDRLFLLAGGRLIDADRPSRLFARDDLEAYGVKRPLYTEALRKLGVTGGEVPVTLQDATRCLMRRPFHSIPAGQSTRPTVSEAQLIIKNVSYSYPSGTAVFRGINLALGSEATAVIGQNGAGKSTLMKLLKGLILPDDGEIWIDGVNSKETTAAKLSSKIGMVFQNPDDQIFKNTVFDEVAFGPRRLFDEKTAASQTLKALEQFGLTVKQKDNPFDLSFSERKRVAIASVLAMNPDVVIFDEPTLGQDAAGIETIKSIIQDLKSQGKQVLAILHDMDFATEMFDRIIVMAGGRILKDGQPRDVFADKQALATAHLEPPAMMPFAEALGIPDPILTLDELISIYRTPPINISNPDGGL
ncbi:ABC transporter ATP-binding protein [Camelliibacillus cellulosilyticus]|uniref:ABC transporter ATP-binding protein n=1 Tax=Camelliibacillus cellulosilyticus TaxID=2174486 RepID=A0ABV9GN72_9BACL